MLRDSTNTATTATTATTTETSPTKQTKLLVLVNKGDIDEGAALAKLLEKFKGSFKTLEVYEETKPKVDYVMTADERLLFDARVTELKEESDALGQPHYSGNLPPFLQKFCALTKQPLSSDMDFMPDYWLLQQGFDSEIKLEEQPFHKCYIHYLMLIHLGEELMKIVELKPALLQEGGIWELSAQITNMRCHILSLQLKQLPSIIKKVCQLMLDANFVLDVRETRSSPCITSIVQMASAIFLLRPEQMRILNNKLNKKKLNRIEKLLLSATNLKYLKHHVNCVLSPEHETETETEPETEEAKGLRLRATALYHLLETL